VKEGFSNTLIIKIMYIFKKYMNYKYFIFIILNKIGILDLIKRIDRKRTNIMNIPFQFLMSNFIYS